MSTPSGNLLVRSLQLSECEKMKSLFSRWDYLVGRLFRSTRPMGTLFFKGVSRKKCSKENLFCFLDPWNRSHKDAMVDSVKNNKQLFHHALCGRLYFLKVVVSESPTSHVLSVCPWLFSHPEVGFISPPLEFGWSCKSFVKDWGRSYTVWLSWWNQKRASLLVLKPLAAF